MEEEEILQLLNASLALRLLKNLQILVPIRPKQQARNGVTRAPSPKAKALGWAAKRESRASPTHTGKASSPSMGLCLQLKGEELAQRRAQQGKEMLDWSVSSMRKG